MQLFWQISQKHFTVFLTTYLLLSWMHLVLFKKHQLIHSLLCDYKKLKRILIWQGIRYFVRCSSRVSTWPTTIDISDVFFIDMSLDISNYADDISRNECAPYCDKSKENLESTIYKIFNWFKDNSFKRNSTKCHFFYRRISLRL